MTRLGPLLGAVALQVAFASAARAETHLGFSAYAGGFNVLNIDAVLDIAPTTYRIQFNSRTAGAFGFVVHGEMQTTVAGVRAATSVLPTRTYSVGNFRGVPRRTQIDYVGGQPQIRILEPATDADRDPVPPDLQRDTIDPESAMAGLIYRVTDTGKCESSARLFDGRRLSEIKAVTVGMEVLHAESGSDYSGPALRCDFEGRQLAGFLHDADPEELKRTQHGSAWLARLSPGGPALPVRIQFSTRFFGAATMYLRSHD